MEMLNFIFDAASIKPGDFTGFTFFIGSVSMLAATVWFLMQHGQVDKKFKDSMLVAALITGAVQFLFIYNIIVSSKFGKKAGKNPWKACSLEWRTKDVPPTHGNFDKELPVVYRWAYDYSVPGADEDYITQDTPPSAVANARAEQT